MLQTYHQTKLALGSDTSLVLVSDHSETEILELYRQLWHSIYQFERQFSRFIPNSELASFNRLAGTTVPITPAFRNILQTARRLAIESQGLYNPFILPALHKAGYTTSFVPGYADDSQETYETRQISSIADLLLTDTSASIPHNSALDLGGCGKGYLADQLADSVLPDWLAGYWLSFGGDIVGNGVDESHQPWRIEIHDSLTDAGTVPYIQTDGTRFAVASSGITVRNGTHNGRQWHHIIDPRTAKPSDSDLITATVFDKQAVRADVFASCAIILGSTEAAPFLKQRKVTGAYLQGRTNTSQPIQKAIGKHTSKVLYV